MAVVYLTKQKHRTWADGRVKLQLPNAAVVVPEPKNLVKDSTVVIKKDLRKRLLAQGGPFAGFGDWLAHRLRIEGNAVTYPDSSAIVRLERIEDMSFDEIAEESLDKVVKAHVEGGVFPDRPKERHFADTSEE